MLKNILKYLHTHPVNVAGAIGSIVSTVVDIATNPNTQTTLSQLPQSKTVNAISAVVTLISTLAMIYRNPEHAQATAAQDNAIPGKG